MPIETKYVEKIWPHAEIVADLAALRQNRPLTHCLTNSVARNFIANVLLAIGASPAMVSAESEVVEFAAVARSVLINLGSVTEAGAAAMLKSAAAAQAVGTPWVLDPAAIGGLRFRTGLAHDLLRYRPSIIKGNASEILTLAGGDGGGKGADSTIDTSAAVVPARALARQSGAVVVLTGATDYVTDGATVIAVPGGHPIMAAVTGTGCALGGVIAAFLGALGDPLRAATAGSAIFADAGARAARFAPGPGSFAVGFIDLLYRIGRDDAGPV